MGLGSPQCSCYVLDTLVLSAESLVSKLPGKFGLYFLVFPDAPAAARIEMLARHCRSEYGSYGKPRPRSILHVSLLNLGLYDDLSSPKFASLEASDAAEQVRATPFTVAFNYVQSFSHPDGRYPLVLRGDDGIVGLEELYQCLGTSMRMVGFKTRPHFTPHVTLIYSRRRISERSIEPISWTVREFSLVLSLRGKTKYIVLDRWPLGADL
jgi:2'-5' RNA ligase